VLATFSGAKYDATTSRLVQSLEKGWCDEVRVYDDVWLTAHDASRVNRWLFDHPGDKNGKRGCGWYFWKSLVLLDALDRFCADGDVVAYVDADTVPIADFRVLYDVAARDGGMFFKSQGHKQTTWCKTDCYATMGMVADYSLPAGVARFMSVKKGDYRAKQLLWEWLAYSVNRLSTTFDPSQLGPEPRGFEEHRTEQAILSNLCHKHGFKLHRECDESGEESQEDRDLYPQLFQQVRQGACPNGVGSRWRNV
jgi:hypothetical protein